MSEVNPIVQEAVNAIESMSLGNELIEYVMGLEARIQLLEQERTLLWETLQFALDLAAGWELRARAMLDDGNLELAAEGHHGQD